MCKVVWGCPADGFRGVVGPMSYEECLQYLKDHRDQIPFDAKGDMHYTPTLDIMDAQTGRLMSWAI